MMRREMPRRGLRASDHRETPPAALRDPGPGDAGARFAAVFTGGRKWTAAPYPRVRERTITAVRACTPSTAGYGWGRKEFRTQGRERWWRNGTRVAQDALDWDGAVRPAERCERSEARGGEGRALARSVTQRRREQADGVRLGRRAADHPAGVNGPPRLFEGFPLRLAQPHGQAPIPSSCDHLGIPLTSGGRPGLGTECSGAGGLSRVPTQPRRHSFRALTRLRRAARAFVASSPRDPPACGLSAAPFIRGLWRPGRAAGGNWPPAWPRG